MGLKTNINKCLVGHSDLGIEVDASWMLLLITFIWKGKSGLLMDVGSALVTRIALPVHILIAMYLPPCTIQSIDKSYQFSLQGSMVLHPASARATAASSSGDYSALVAVSTLSIHW